MLISCDSRKLIKNRKVRCIRIQFSNGNFILELFSQLIDYGTDGPTCAIL